MNGNGPTGQGQGFDLQTTSFIPAPAQTPNQPEYSQKPPIYDQNSVPVPQGKQTFSEVFSIERPKYHDLWAGILLLAVFGGFVVISGLSLYRYSEYHSFNGTGINDGLNTFSLNTNTIVMFAFLLCVAFVVSWLYFLLVRFFTKQIIWITAILNILIGIVTAIDYLIRKYWSGGIVFALFTVFAIICLISWRPRIPLAVCILQQTMDVARMKKAHVFLVSFLGGLVTLAFAAWFLVTLVAIYAAYMPSNSSSAPNPSCASGGCSSAKVAGLVAYMTFAGYWISEWLKNTIHTTVAGIFGSWYFCAGSQSGEIASGATMGSFRRATTVSFGSVSLGSLFTAIINMLRHICSVAQHSDAAQGNLIGSIMFSCLGCLLGLVDWAAHFINRYAFSHIALYGKPYFAAAKDTWTLMKDRGIDVLVNDCLVGPVLTMGSVMVAYLCALFTWLWLEHDDPAYNRGATFTPVLMAFSFLIGLQVCQIFLTPIKSGVDTMFVAMAWDPQVAMTDHAVFWNRLTQVYPRINNRIHV